MKLMELLPPNETMYRALAERDSSFEGIFFAGVRTTGIFCRPTCSAKKPARQNVEFFPTPNEALLGGYRPCLRCRPMDPQTRPPELIERLRAEIEKAPGGRLTDKELSALAIDPSTARRQFKRHYGMTFQAYHRARRMGLALREVRRGSRVDAAQNGSGFESASGFREAFTKVFGDPPTAAKERTPLLAERIDTPLGTMVAVADDAGLRLLEFADRRALEREIPILRKRLRTNVVPGEHPHPGKNPRATCRLFLGQEFGIRSAACSGRIGFSNARLEGSAIDSRRRNALLFMDGGEVRNSWRAPCRRSRQWHEHALHRHSMSSCHSRGWNFVRLRWRRVAQEMAARARAKVEEV